MNLSGNIPSAVTGFAIGDALGVPVEFLSRERLKKSPVTGMTGYGTYSQPPGTWSDDTSLMLCTLESLKNGLNLHDLGIRFHRWLNEAYMTPHGEVFDCGVQTRFAIARIGKIIEFGDPIVPIPRSEAREKENGNGSLMRILPLAFYLQDVPYSQHFRIVDEVSSMTHPHMRSVLGCFIYMEFAIGLLSGISRKDSYKLVRERVRTLVPKPVSQAEYSTYTRILGGDIWDYPEESIKSTGYVVSTLEAVLWAFMRGGSFIETLLTAVNMGDDTDTIAALTGGLAGIWYGMEGIPAEWRDQLVGKEIIEAVLNSTV